jgi:hypothetical protein
MATKTQIASDIKAHTGFAPRAWRIGLTHDPVERKKYWGESQKENIVLWKQWQADSLSDAHEIEAYFIHTVGMKGGTGGDLTYGKAVFVYVF